MQGGSSKAMSLGTLGKCTRLCKMCAFWRFVVLTPVKPTILFPTEVKTLSFKNIN